MKESVPFRAEAGIRSRSAIDVLTDGRYVWADKTSLGGDNGIAVAMIFAILSDNELPHPPIEAALTVDEETGMDGAAVLDCSDLRGRKLININSEEEGIFTASCAGGVCISCFLPGERQPLSGESGYTVTISGLECGLFAEKLPGLDAISMGPNLTEVHSVNERLDVASTARVYELLCEILRRSTAG